VHRTDVSMCTMNGMSHRLNVDVSEARQNWHNSGAQQHSKHISSNQAASRKADTNSSSDTDDDDTVEQTMSAASSVTASPSSRKTSTVSRQNSFKRSRSMQRALERR
jgi:hypothetical protein